MCGQLLQHRFSPALLALVVEDDPFFGAEVPVDRTWGDLCSLGYLFNGDRFETAVKSDFGLRLEVDLNWSPTRSANCLTPGLGKPR
jgi:hypothetical protein